MVQWYGLYGLSKLYNTEYPKSRNICSLRRGNESEEQDDMIALRMKSSKLRKLVENLLSQPKEETVDPNEIDMFAEEENRL